MKRLFIFLALFFFAIQSGFSQNANEILQERGEVYFSFDFNTKENGKEELAAIGRIISIDKLTDKKVFAYANAKEFAAFRSLSIEYQLLTAPSMLLSKAEVDGGSRSNWDFYPTYSEYIDIMNQFAADFPSLCEVVNIGESDEGRDLLFIHINDSLGVEQGDPEFMYTSSMHGDEITGYVLMLHLIEYMLQNYGVDDRITNMVNSIDIWINPLANPDGTYAGGNNTVYGATRYNANFVNLNRNYPDPDDGPHPDGEAYQAETQAFMDFAEAHQFSMSANFHGGSEVVNYPWDTWSKLTADNDWWIQVCRQYADTAHAHSPSGYLSDLNNGITNGYDWYTIEGGRQDYMNYEQHCREVTIELSEVKLPLPETLPDFWEYNYRSMLNYMEKSLFGLRGLVTSAQNGEAVYAEVFIEGHDKDESQVYSAGSTGSYHRYLEAGLYSISYRSGGYETMVIDNVRIASDSTTYVNVQLDSLVGIEEERPENLVSVYPNPVTDMVNIVLASMANEISILNLQGKTIQRKTCNEKNIRLDLSSLKKGMYLLRIRFANNSVTKKLIIY